MQWWRKKKKFDVNHKKKGKKKMWRLFFEIRKIKFLLTRNKSFCYLCILSFLITKSDKIVASKCRKKNKRKICLFDYYLHSNNQHRVITIANTSLCQCLDFDFLLWWFLITWWRRRRWWWWAFVITFTSATAAVAAAAATTTSTRRWWTAGTWIWFISIIIIGFLSFITKLNVL